MIIKKQGLVSASHSEFTLEALRQIAPSAFIEVRGEDGLLTYKINFDVLRELLGDTIADTDEESFGFQWVGKQTAKRAAAEPTRQTLRPVVEDSKDWDNTENLYIEGDNLEVLKLLQRAYLGKVKMIYIDPPYNTGNDFVYDDDFAMSSKEMDEAMGNLDEDGNRLRKNLDTNPRYHSDWCSMMYSRLLVARTLLANDGVIFISIDDNEVHHLRKICDEVFGASNFVGQLIWEQGRKSMAAQIAINHEYCLVYSKDNSERLKFDAQYQAWRSRKQGLSEIYEEYDRLKTLYGEKLSLIEQGLKSWYKSLSDNHPSKAHAHYWRVDQYLGIYYQGDISQGTGKGGRFDIIHPITGKPCKLPTGGWRFSEQKLPELLESHKIVFGKDETTVPCLKRYLCETEKEVTASVFYKDGRGASSRLTSLLGGKVFDYPKDEEVIKNFISLSCPSISPDSLIMDFFSGSATTAHAVMQLNAEDGGKRKYICVQIPEETPEDSEARKAGYNTICEIGKERIRRAGAKIQAEHPEATIDTGFRVLRLDSSNMEEVYFEPAALSQENIFAQVDSVKYDRTELDLLFGCMVDWGVQLSYPLRKEEVAGKHLHIVNEGALVACFDKEINIEAISHIAEMKPLRVIFRESCFTTDADKLNIYEQFKQLCGWNQDEVYKRIHVI